jgi:hypothetical protein
VAISCDRGAVIFEPRFGSKAGSNAWAALQILIIFKTPRHVSKMRGIRKGRGWRLATFVLNGTAHSLFFPECRGVGARPRHDAADGTPATARRPCGQMFIVPFCEPVLVEGLWDHIFASVGYNLDRSSD